MMCMICRQKKQQRGRRVVISTSVCQRLVSFFVVGCSVRDVVQGKTESDRTRKYTGEYEEQ